MNQIQRYKEAVRLLHRNCPKCLRKDTCLHKNNPIALATQPPITVGLELEEIETGRLSCWRKG